MMDSELPDVQVEIRIKEEILEMQQIMKQLIDGEMEADPIFAFSVFEKYLECLYAFDTVADAFMRDQGIMDTDAHCLILNSDGIEITRILNNNQ